MHKKTVIETVIIIMTITQQTTIQLEAMQWNENASPCPGTNVQFS